MPRDDAVPDTSTPVRRPFYDTLGLQLLEAKAGVSRVTMAADPKLANSRGDVHGGAIAGLMDAALSSAARSGLPEGYATATITYTTSFLVPGSGKLTARGNVLRSGRSIVSVEARVTDEQGTLVAQAMGTMRVIRP
jgi:uncharacterized protein (TIGR00369 family)